MIRVAIVGDIGSGKTYISKLFGYPLFNADFEVSKIYKKDKNCYQKIKTQFPKLNFSFPLQINSIQFYCSYWIKFLKLEMI